MIEETAHVVVAGAAGVWVETQRQSACGHCSARKGCGTAVLGKVLGQKRSRVQVANPDDTPLRVGDEVIIGIDESALVRGSMAIYLVPLLSFFLFGLLGQVVAQQLFLDRIEGMESEGLSILFSLAGLFAGFVWARRYVHGDRRYQPVILSNAPPAVFFHNTQ